MKFSAIRVFRRASVGLLATSLLFLAACSEERKLANKAEWLCTYDQLQRLDSDWIPEDADLADYIHSMELKYLERKPQRGGDDLDDDDRWRELDADALRRLATVRADHTRCTTHQVHLFESYDLAFVEVRRSVPDVELSAEDVADATSDELAELFGGVHRRERSTHTLGFARTDDGWRADFGVKERVIEAELAEIDEREEEIQRELPRARSAEEEEEQLHALTMFRVESASLNLVDRRERWGDLEAEVTVRGTNRSEESIGKIDFEVIYRAPGQEALSEEFVFDGHPIGGEETREFQLEPTDPYSLFGDEIVVDDGASLDVTVVRIYDRRNRVLVEAGEEIDPGRARESLGLAGQDAERLENELLELEERREELRNTLFEWHEERFPDIDLDEFGIEPPDLDP